MKKMLRKVSNGLTRAYVGAAFRCAKFSSRGDLHEISGKALFFVLIIAFVFVVGPKILGLVTTYSDGSINTISSTFGS